VDDHECGLFELTSCEPGSKLETVREEAYFLISSR
jgi:hypothetical protein